MKKNKPIKVAPSSRGKHMVQVNPTTWIEVSSDIPASLAIERYYKRVNQSQVIHNEKMEHVTNIRKQAQDAVDKYGPDWARTDFED